MILYGAVILVIITNGYEAKSHSNANTKPIGYTKPEPNALNAGELAKLIHKVNQDDEGDSFENDNFKALDLDYIGIRNTDKNEPVPKIMKLLQKNYDANNYNHPTSDARVRIHYIKNPDVLEQYKNNMRKRHYSTSSSSEDSNSSDYELRLERLLRRNAIFRLGKSSIDDQKPALRNNDARIKKNSAEHDRIIHFEPNDYTDKLTIAFKDTKNDNHDKKRPDSFDKPKRNKESYDVDSKKDAWDMITKNYNNWDSKDDKKKDNYNYNNEYNKNDKYSDGYKKNDKNNDEYKKNNKYNDDYKKNDKYNDDYKKKDSYNDNYKKNDKYNDAYNNDDKYKDDYNKNDKYNDNHKKRDSYSDDYKKNDRHNDDYKKGNKYNDDYKKNDNYNDEYKRNDKYNDDKESPQTKFKKESNRDNIDQRMDWEKTKDSKSLKDNSWDSWKSKSIEKSDMQRKKKEKSEDWDGPQKKGTIGHASFEKKDWDNKDDYKDKPRQKTTEDWHRNEGNKKPFVPQISDYYQSRPRLRDNVEKIAFKAFGRTSIPFVGKKGIYEEK